jgi:antitoxin (DNA-binding transcriptional repressor) of toxin-antitoxin stability system
MIKLNIHEAKTHLSRYLALVEQGECILLCRGNVPVAEIRRVPPQRRRPRPIGLARGKVTPPPRSSSIPCPRTCCPLLRAGRREGAAPGLHRGGMVGSDTGLAPPIGWLHTRSTQRNRESQTSARLRAAPAAAAERRRGLQSSRTPQPNTDRTSLSPACTNTSSADGSRMAAAEP